MQKTQIQYLETQHGENKTSKQDSKQTKTEEIKIELLNGTTNSKLLTEVTKKLNESGYNVTKTGNTSKTSKTSIINRTNRTTSETNALKKALGIGTTSKKSNNSKVDYTIIIGADYK